MCGGRGEGEGGGKKDFKIFINFSWRFLMMKIFRNLRVKSIWGWKRYWIVVLIVNSWRELRLFFEYYDYNMIFLVYLIIKL